MQTREKAETPELRVLLVRELRDLWLTREEWEENAKLIGKWGCLASPSWETHFTVKSFPHITQEEFVSKTEGNDLS
jgi:hypothetical protein